MQRAKLFLLVFVLLIAASPSVKAQIQKNSATPTSEYSKKVQEIVLDIEKNVARVRGLAIKEPLASRLMTQDELIEFAKEEITKQYGDNFPSVDYMYRVWGLIPTKTPPLYDLYMVALREQVGGLYDPHSNTLFILQGFDPSSSVGRVILSHEIGHALQDQHFDLAAAIKDRFDNEDALYAFQAVLEGDATLLMTEYTIDTGDGLDVQSVLSLMQTTQGQFYQMPYALQQMFVQPYLSGSKFMTEMVYMKGVDRNQLFVNPPVSTEQVLHPEKYTLAERDDPTSVPLEKRLALMKDGWNKAPLRNTMGEFQVKILMDIWNGLAVGSDVAAGWDGDTYMFYNKENDFFSEWRSIWDTVVDASDFYDAMIDLMQRRSTKPIYYVSWGIPDAKKIKPLTIEQAFKSIGDPYKKSDDTAIVNGTNWNFVIARRGKDVYCAIFTPDALKQLDKK